eukprot:64216-Rhodomonas_salina.1
MLAGSSPFPLTAVRLPSEPRSLRECLHCEINLKENTSPTPFAPVMPRFLVFDSRVKWMGPVPVKMTGVVCGGDPGEVCGVRCVVGAGAEGGSGSEGGECNNALLRHHPRETPYLRQRVRIPLEPEPTSRAGLLAPLRVHAP